ncbi:conserved hypothetical protein [Paraburkholderia sabiae]|nr:conserved hypothetical protein [Paraburkholderia sabiae]
MTEDSDRDKLKGPGGMTPRQKNEQKRKSAPTHNSPVPKNRWQRWVRYVWGRSGRR